MTPARLTLLALLLFACKSDNDKSSDPETQAILDVKEYTEEELHALNAAALRIQAAAPTRAADWTSGDLGTLEAAWRDARVSYERTEGPIAVLFPELDAATDERYDGFIAEGADTHLFDGEGVIGVHGIERIVWAGRHPPDVVAFESALPNYLPAAFPANDTEATAFRDELCQRLVDDTNTMHEEFEPVALDSAAAFRGVIGSMAEQYEKVNLALTGEDESRYAQHTLGDMRANLEGGRAIYDAFHPWIDAEGGEAVDAEIDAGFERVEAAYAAISGDAIPPVPATWNPDDPSEAELATEYGQLWLLLSTEADPTIAGSLVERMGAAADLLGIPQFAP